MGNGRVNDQPAVERKIECGDDGGSNWRRKINLSSPTTSPALKLLQHTELTTVVYDRCFVDTNLLSKMVFHVTADALRVFALEYAGSRSNPTEDRFHGHFGSSSQATSILWALLQNTDVEELKLDNREDSEEGMNQFLQAIFYLWTYPKNCYLTASRFDVCEK